MKNILLMFAAALILLGCDCNNKWTPKILSEEVKQDHFLPDYSFAGYKWGEEKIPEFSGVEINVNNFGAVPDDNKDDTKAVLKALKAAHGVDGAVKIFFPKGKYLITKILNINRSDILVTGELKKGKPVSTLYFPKALNELPVPRDLTELQEYLLENDKRQREKKRGVDEPFSLYSWTGGFIWTNYPGERGKAYLQRYNKPKEQLAEILSGKRGEHTVTVKDASLLKEGEIVKLNWYNVEGKESSLVKYLYDNQEVRLGSRHWENPEIALTRQEVTILKIVGNTVTIKEPLLNDLRSEWKPDITRWNYIANVGIENLNIEFLYQEYKYHHVEYGFNGIYLTNTAHSWIKNVNFRNGDNAILTDLSSNISIDNIKVYGRKYHYAVHFGDCYNMLATNIFVHAPTVHALTFNTGSRSCIYSDCLVTTTPTIDQHSGLNYQNLFDNCEIYVDDPKQKIFTMGGAKYWWPSHAAFSTIWNLKINFQYDHNPADTIKIKGVTDSPSERLVGVHANYPIDIYYPLNTYFEGLNKDNISVPSLYKYQVNQRLSSREK